MASPGDDGCPNLGKSAWPELLGKQGNAAVAIIEKENPSVDAFTVLEGSIVTADVRCDRVRVWIDKKGVVTRVPVVG